jgi:aryl-alcohol dehydrogenase-like predicted oxidoreductase
LHAINAMSKRRGRKTSQPGAAIPRRPLGRTGEQVSALGLGGYHIGAIGNQRDAIHLVHEAIDAGVTFLDNAWEYHEGRSEEVIGKAIADRRDRVFLMTKVCTHGRDRREAMRQLEQSLRRLKTDYLDLWQIHECVYFNDPERHFARGGAVEALEQAKREGKVRFVGFTGHKDPSIHLEMLSHGFPFDTCQLPLNCFDASFRSFEEQVLPELLRRGIAPLGMKSLGGDGRQVTRKVITAEEGLRYAMSLPVAATISGIDSSRVLRQNLRVAADFTPMSDRDMRALRSRVREDAEDGRFELYKTTATHEGEIGRAQHGFPSQEELSA